MTDPERMVYAAAFAASLRANYHCEEPLSYRAAGQQAALDGYFAVEMLRDSSPKKAGVPRGSYGANDLMVLEFCEVEP